MANEFQGPVMVPGKSTRNAANGLNLDGVMALICGGVAVTDAVQLETAYTLLSPEDATTVGVNTAYDVTNDVVVYEHIHRFFNRSPLGKIYLLVVAQGTTLQAMTAKIRGLVLNPDTNREIKCVALALNPAAGYTPTFSAGYEVGIVTAMDAAQAVVDDLRAEGYYLPSVIIEGRMNPSITISSSQDWRGEEAPQVSIVGFQDPVIAGRGGKTARYADVGTALGDLAQRRVSECLGSVDVANKPLANITQETYPLTDKAEGFYLNAQLSSGLKFSDLTVAQLTALGAKGLIYAGMFSGFDGFYISNSHVCATLTGTYAYIEDNRVWCKAANIARKAVFPTIRGNFGRNKDGSMRSTYKSTLKEKIKIGLAIMISSGEIGEDPGIEVNETSNGSGSVKLALKYLQEGVQRDLTGVVGPF